MSSLDWSIPRWAPCETAAGDFRYWMPFWIAASTRFWSTLSKPLTSCPDAPGAPNAFLYYYLYAVERLGMLYDTGKIGGHLWYPEGAKVLLDAQKPDGSWDASLPKTPTWDTCFAILFLKRATRPLVATGGK